MRDLRVVAAEELRVNRRQREGWKWFIQSKQVGKGNVSD
jgi:hypothetical protein